MDGSAFKNLGRGILTGSLIVIGLAIFVTWLFTSENSIRSPHPIEPEIKIKVEKDANGIVRSDTTYIYREP